MYLPPESILVYTDKPNIISLKIKISNIINNDDLEKRQKLDAITDIFTNPDHCYAFEIWPNPLPEATYPMLLPRYSGRIYTKTFHEAEREAGQMLNDNEALGRASHIRSQCNPPHVGINIPGGN